MTTNHIERLDPALIRPGRIDVMELIDDASPSQARRLFLKFYGDHAEDDIVGLATEMERIVAQSPKRVSMATLQGHFIRHEPRAAVESAQTMFI